MGTTQHHRNTERPRKGKGCDPQPKRNPFEHAKGPSKSFVEPIGDEDFGDFTDDERVISQLIDVPEQTEGE